MQWPFSIEIVSSSQFHHFQHSCSSIFFHMPSMDLIISNIHGYIMLLASIIDITFPCTIPCYIFIPHHHHCHTHLKDWPFYLNSSFQQFLFLYLWQKSTFLEQCWLKHLHLL